jgi:hypothetical protein
MSGRLYLSYTVGIETPDDGIDIATLAEINADAQEHDTTPEQRIQRWIGGDISEMRAHLAEGLPEGWRVSVIQNH